MNKIIEQLKKMENYTGENSDVLRFSYPEWYATDYPESQGCIVSFEKRERIILDIEVAVSYAVGVISQGLFVLKVKAYFSNGGLSVHLRELSGYAPQQEGE